MSSDPQKKSSKSTLDLVDSLDIDLDELPPPKSNDRPSMPPKRATLSFEDDDEPKVGLDASIEVVEQGEDFDPKEELWLLSLEDGDYGPFDVETVIQYLHKDKIHENTKVTHIANGTQLPLQAYRIFRDALEDYIPKREERKRLSQEEREKRIQQVKSASKFSGLGALAIALFFAVTAIIAYLSLPDPMPIEYEKSLAVFPYAFQMPRIEVVELKVDEDAMAGIFDPKADEETKRQRRKALLAKLQAKKKSKHRRRRRRSKKQASSGEEEIIDSFDDMSDAESLGDDEIFMVVYGDRVMGKLEKCINKYPSQASSVTVTFNIRPSGNLTGIKVKSKKHGKDYEACIKSVYQSIGFRAFGGSTKRTSVSYSL